MSRIFRFVTSLSLSCGALTMSAGQETLQVLPSSGSLYTLESRSAGATVDQTFSVGSHAGVQVSLQRNQSRARFVLPTPLDATTFDGMMVEVENVGAHPAVLDLTIRNVGNGEPAVGTWDTIPPGRKRNLLAWFSSPGANVPYRLGFAMPSINVPFQVSYIANGRPNMSALQLLQIWNGGTRPMSVRVNSIQFVKRRTSYTGIIDKYGQASFLDFPGKATNDNDLLADAIEEQQNLDAKSPIDPLGGVPGMRSTRATGRWRIERAPSGRMFVVSPTGKRMWIMGVNTVIENYASRYQNRDEAFQEVIPRTTQNEEVFWLRRNHLTDGLGWCYDFGRSNMFKKYGENWKEDNRQRIVQRLKRWGFNTVTGVVDGATPINNYPVMLSCKLSNFTQRIATPYVMHYQVIDVFHSDFEPYAETTIKDLLNQYKTVPVIGIHVDNELSWGLRGNQTLQYSLPIGVLNSSSTVKAKEVFVNWLKTKYSNNIASLNSRWGTSYESFAAMSAPLNLPTSNLNANIRADLSLLLSFYVDRYYGTVRRILNRIGYRGLFLGTRDAPGATPREVWRAASRHADALTINLYTENDDLWREVAGIPKPVLIGEYNYTSSNAGHFTWVRDLSCYDQQERAERNYQYLVRAATTPNIIGACWWSYSEYAPIGRWWDDERMQTGLVDIKDSPYEDLVSSFRTFMLNLKDIRRP